MDTFLNEMLGGESNKDARKRFRSLFDVSGRECHWVRVVPDRNQEYEARETPESKLVKVRWLNLSSLLRISHSTTGLRSFRIGTARRRVRAM